MIVIVAPHPSACDSLIPQLEVSDCYPVVRACSCNYLIVGYFLKSWSISQHIIQPTKDTPDIFPSGSPSEYLVVRMHEASYVLEANIAF